MNEAFFILSKLVAKFLFNMIPKTFDEAFSQVKVLAEKFNRQEAHYLSPKYQEAEVQAGVSR